MDYNEDIDFDRALVLMNLIEKITTVAPMSSALMGLAQRELKEINDTALKIQQQVAAEEQKKKDDEAAERQHEANVAAKEADDVDDDETAPLANRRL